jgi:sarcosine oxidase, subunit delta
MLLIACPHCGPRAEIEFRCGGEAHIVRPTAPEAESDAGWRDYLFSRKSPKGLQLERWNHAHGCQRWFNVARDTVTDEILAVYGAGEEPPAGLQARLAAEA